MTEDKKQTQIIGKPRVCCIDLKNDVIEALEAAGMNLYKEGSLGDKIRVPNSSTTDFTDISYGNHNFPYNIHEYDIFIIDLDNYKEKIYNYDNHKYKILNDARYIQSSYPEILFDPRPHESNNLREHLNNLKNKHLVIVFATESYRKTYLSVLISGRNHWQDSEYTHNIYSLLPENYCYQRKCGIEINIDNKDNELSSFLNKYKDKTTYNQTFYKSESPNMIPLATNADGDIISYYHCEDDEFVYVFPKIKDQKEFLLEFLSQVAPSKHPEIFPYSTEFSWKNQKEYWLPNHSVLLDEENEINKKYEVELQKQQEKIEKNIGQYSFLHNILTETGDDLVNNVAYFLDWLGFSNIIDVDNEESDSKVLEEDLQCVIDEGLLVIEVKGIGGTSTDSECSQITKIKHRRMKERKAFDVFALYIVNHQRHLPPKKRKNPPFSKHQISDAESDERGLLTTWQLFNLYFDIKNNIITKEQARKKILEFGLIDFRPPNLIYIDVPEEFFRERTVCVINIKDIPIKVGDELLIEKNSKFSIRYIKGIMLNDKPVNEASNGEIGLELDRKISKKSTIWKKPDA